STQMPSAIVTTSRKRPLASMTQWGCRSRTISSLRCRLDWSKGTARSYRRGASTRRDPSCRTPSDPSQAPSGPTQAVQLVVVDAEVVRELVHHGDAHLVDDLLGRLAHLAQRHPVDRDPVGHDQPAVVVAFGEGHTLVQAEQVLGLVAVL